MGWVHVMLDFLNPEACVGFPYWELNDCTLTISVFSPLYREIGQKCAQELSRDTAGAKGFAVFLAELAERIPAVLMSSMCILLDHLDGEVVWGILDLSRGFSVEILSSLSSSL